MEPILEDNQKLLTAPRPTTKLWLQGDRAWVRVASIPLILLEQLWQKGIKFSDPDFVKNIKPMLNSSEYEKLRTAPGKL